MRKANKFRKYGHKYMMANIGRETPGLVCLIMCRNANSLLTFAYRNANILECPVRLCVFTCFEDMSMGVGSSAQWGT